MKSPLSRRLVFLTGAIVALFVLAHGGVEAQVKTRLSIATGGAAISISSPGSSRPMRF